MKWQDSRLAEDSREEGFALPNKKVLVFTGRGWKKELKTSQEKWKTDGPKKK